MDDATKQGGNGQPRMTLNDEAFQAKIIDRVSQLLTNDASPWPMARQWFSRFLSPNDTYIDDECHYPPTSALIPNYWRDLYDRDPVANRVVQLMPKECWGPRPMVFEDEDADNITDFEEAWDGIPKSLVATGVSWHQDEHGSPVYSYCERADSLSRIGHFGIILLGIDDGLNLEQPLDGAVTTENKLVPIYREVSYGKSEGIVQNDGSIKYRRSMRREMVGVRVVKSQLDRHLSFPLHKDTPLSDTERTQLVANLKDVNAEELAALDRIQNRERREREVAANRVKAGRRNPVQAHDLEDLLSTPSENANPEGRNQYTGGTGKHDASVVAAMKLHGQDAIPTSLAKAALKAAKKAHDNHDSEDSTPDDAAYEAAKTVIASGIRELEKDIPVNWRTKSAWVENASTHFFQETDGDGVENVVTDVTGRDLYGGQLASTPGSTPSGTDQQYFGVQFGPPEKVSDKPTKKKRKLVFMRCYDESLLQVVRYEWNVRNPRFGMPTMYRVTLNDPRETHGGVGLPLATVFVHWSRVIHLNDVHANAGPSEIFSPPVLRAVLNPVLDDKKVCGAGAEGYYKACITALSWETHPQLGGDVDVDEAGMTEQVDKFFKGLKRALMSKGGSWKTLAPTVVDPTPHHTIAIERICIQLGCPVRVFKGSERGELASSQDDSKWNDIIRARQNGYCTPRILVPLIDRLIMVGVLPEPEGYTVEWPDLESLSDKDKAAILLQKTQAYVAYTQGMESIVPPQEYMTKFDDFDEEQAEAIIDAASKAHADQDTMTIAPKIAGQDAAPAAGTAAEQEQKQQAQQAKQMADATAKAGATAASAPVKVKPGEKLVQPPKAAVPPINPTAADNPKAGA